MFVSKTRTFIKHRQTRTNTNKTEATFFDKLFFDFLTEAHDFTKVISFRGVCFQNSNIFESTEH